MAQTYGYQYHTFPVLAEEFSFEGSFKRFTSFPTPKQVYDYALMGLPKYFPLTKEPITVDMITPFLESAITEIEMKLGCNLSEVTHFHSEDWLEGSFTNNMAGVRLQKWPATQVVGFTLKYPHTNTPTPYQKYNIPSHWIFLRYNRVNVVASDGSVTVNTDNSGIGNAGLFNYISGFNRGIWGPGAIEIIYKAGFSQDKLPSSVADLIKTWAAHRFITDILPVMFPQASVTVSIDGVSQSVGLMVQQLLTERLTNLEKKKAELISALEANYGRQVKMSFLGS